MSKCSICRTVHQYSKGSVSREDMKKLQEIADDYCKVKNYVYQRYGGIQSLSKIYPGYTVQNEMTESGLRAQLGMPSVYFYLAVFDSLKDIKTQWSKTKNMVLEAIKTNERFTPEDRHYLRFVIKISGCFDNILTGKPVEILEDMKKQYESAAFGVDTVNLNRYLCRQVRNKRKKLHTDKANGFSIAERAYRYGDSNGQFGIFISTKENRKRVFVPLTDKNRYKKQLYIQLKPEGSIEIAVPVETEVKSHKDYENEIGISLGMWQLFTTDQGNIYGERIGAFHTAVSDYVRTAGGGNRRERVNNPGNKKYKSKKAKLDAGMQTYINQEINRMLWTEKPKVIYIPKLPQAAGKGVNKTINHSVNLWRKGYMTERLKQKCIENGIELREVFGKGISILCSNCGENGVVQKETFTCAACGCNMDKKQNAARNALRRGKTEDGAEWLQI